VKTAVLGLEMVKQTELVGENCSSWTGDGIPYEASKYKLQFLMCGEIIRMRGQENCSK